MIDAGVEAASPVRQALTEHGLSLAGVIATHGHVDHIADAARLANQAGVPLWLHSADDFMLTKPSAGLGPGSEGLMFELFGADALPAPQQRRDLAGLAELDLAGLHFSLAHAPGHTPGCVILTAQDEQGPVTWCGDVVFAGSIGRTDLPRGDAAVMRASLRDVVLGLDDATRLLPGHGPATTMARERRRNPYLQAGFLALGGDF